MSDNKRPGDGAIIIDKDGLPRARSVHEFNMMSDQQQAALLAAYQATCRGGSAASSASPRRPDPIPELPKVFDSDDREIGLHDNSWK
jgi:hypothetical protein